MFNLKANEMSLPIIVNFHLNNPTIQPTDLTSMIQPKKFFSWASTHSSSMINGNPSFLDDLIVDRSCTCHMTNVSVTYVFSYGLVVALKLRN